MSNELPELKVCPFCGGDFEDVSWIGELLVTEKREINPDSISVKCPHCSAKGPSGWNNKEAFDNWNNRGEKWWE